LSELDAQIGISALYTRDEWIRLSDEASQLYGLNDRKLDESHDARSTQRKLNEKLVLITKQMLPAPDPSNKFIAPWQLPLQMCNEGESLREVYTCFINCHDDRRTSKFQSVERCLKNTLFTSGTVPSIRILGNAPLARYQYTYPKDVRIWKGVDGSIVSAIY
jgi:hypothetical protein